MYFSGANTGREGTQNATSTPAIVGWMPELEEQIPHYYAYDYVEYLALNRQHGPRNSKPSMHTPPTINHGSMWVE